MPLLAEPFSMMLPNDKISTLIFLSVCTILLLGAGCKNPTSTDTSTSTDIGLPSVVVKEPADHNIVEYAIESCEQRGHTSVLKYDTTSKQTIPYCQFQDGYACNTLSFLQGTCTTTSTNRIFLKKTDGLAENLRTCTDDEVPVCATGGITYVNSCIAMLQQAEVLHPGVCTDAEISSALASSGNVAPNTSGSGTSGSGTSGGHSTSGGTTATTQTGIPVWTTYLTSISESKANDASAPRAESCTYGSTRVFYLVESCPHCFSTLYDNAGKVICHPHNDIAHECPSYFDKDKRGANCKKI